MGEQTVIRNAGQRAMQVISLRTERKAPGSRELITHVLQSSLDSL